jgi:D-aminopeptidase
LALRVPGGGGRAAAIHLRAGGKPEGHPMTDINSSAIAAAIATLPDLCAGPGGVAGVVWQGRVLAAQAWGHADLDSHLAMTPETRLPLCSVSKQFTCAALLGACGTPEALDGALPAYLPAFRGPLPRVRDLCNNQSGLRDYWALTVLHGARAEQPFARQDAARVFARMRSGHFAPGTRYSYSNGNFRLLADMLESETGETLQALCARHVLGPAGMSRTELAPDTRTPPDGVVGYEGNDATGYLPAANGVWWMGDAGIVASLNDMLAYERWIDATRDDPAGLYRQISEPQTFRDGAVANYGFGLHRVTIGGHEFTGHGGALRGFRVYRMNSRSARLSVVVMLNHHADAQGGANAVARAAFGVAQQAASDPAAHWAGTWICPETGLLARLDPQRGGVALRFGTSVELMRETPRGTLQAGQNMLRRDGAALMMQRPVENLSTRLIPVPPDVTVDGAGLAGRYVSEELGATLTIEHRGGGTAGWFEGLLGRGRPERMHPAGGAHWIMSTRRALDAPAPGDWTITPRLDTAGQVTGLEIGCWLARKIALHRV